MKLILSLVLGAVSVYLAVLVGDSTWSPVSKVAGGFALYITLTSASFLLYGLYVKSKFTRKLRMGEMGTVQSVCGNSVVVGTASGTVHVPIQRSSAGAYSTGNTVVGSKYGRLIRVDTSTIHTS